MITLIWITILLLVLVHYLQKAYSRFSSYGVNTIKPIPIFGNSFPVFSRQRHISEDWEILYKAFPEDRFVGRYEIIQPVVIIRDLELIKNVTIKDFEHFLDHKPMVDDTVDPLFGRNLFSLRGEEWKDMRSTLSPAFTSSKMRGMVPFMLDVNNSMISVLKKKIEASEKGHVDLDSKDLTTRYANDVIASCAFGVKVESHADENNEFYRNVRSTARPSFRMILLFLGYSSFPKLMKKLNVKLFSEETTDFFRNLILNNMRNREIHNILRPPPETIYSWKPRRVYMCKLKYNETSTEEADTGYSTVEESEIGKKTVSRVWSDTDLIAQATLFFLAGYETVSTAMSFILHELAVNPDVQEKLINEIREHDAKIEGKFSYNSIQDLKYMDMVISEVLRLWPPARVIERLCIKDYNLGKANDKAKKDYILRKDENILIPIWALHRDSKYFPNPHKFDPERFSDANKHKIIPYTYVPFGSGPRNCIGSRFALCEIKVMLYQFLQNFEVTVCEKTAIPAKLATNTFNNAIDGGHWVRIKLRK